MRFLGSSVKVLRRFFNGIKSGAFFLLAAIIGFILDKRKRQFSLAFYVSLVTIVIFTQILSTLTVAASQTSVSKTTSADWDLGTNTGVTTTGDEIKLTGRSTSWYNSTAPAFYDLDYSYRRTITFDNSAQAENLANFPVMVKATNDELNWSSIVQADLDDVIFVDADNTTLLNWEWEKKDKTAESIAWVQVPQVDASSSTDYIYMYYANPAAVDQSSAVNVWSNGYAARWRFSEASGNILDSTAFGHTGTPSGDPTYGAAGKIDGAVQFDGTDGIFDVANPTDLDFTNNFNISLWFKPTNLTQTNKYVFEKYSASYRYAFLWEYVNNSIEFWSLGFTGSDPRTGSQILLSDTNWHHIVYSYDGTTWAGYLDGAPVFSVARTFALVQDATSIMRINVPGGSNTAYTADEMRMGATARSANWIAAEYKNQGPNTFTTFGAPQNSDSYSYRRKITFDNSAQAENLTSFPVVVKANNSSLAWSSLIQADMDDVIFVDADDSTPLSFEWEAKNPAGDSVAWAKVPQINLSSSADYIYMYYGNGSGVNLEHQEGVWSNNYIAVYHMNEASGTIYDATKNSYDGSIVGSITYGATGKIGNAVSKAAGANYINISSAVTHLNGSGRGSFTMEGWANMTAPTSRNPLFGTDYDFNNLIEFGTSIDVADGKMHTSTRGNGAMAEVTATNVLSADTYYHVALTNNGDNVYIYLNGAQDGTSGTNITTTSVNNAGLTIGRNASGSVLVGSMDEFRLSSTPRSALWVAAEYKNQTDTFNTIAALEGKNFLISASDYWHASPTGTGGGSGIINTLWNGGWGTPNGFSSNVTIPANTSIAFQIRSSAVGGADDGDWTAWSSLGTAISTGEYTVANASMPAITLGANKYLQTRAYLATTDGQSTPVLADYTIYYLADVDAPTNPTTTALTVGGTSQTTGSWTNDTGAVSASFSGATDPGSESGLVGYYLYLGTNASADPSTYQAHVGALGDTQTWVTGTTISSADDGKTFYLRAKTKDNANNTSAAATLFTFSYDSTLPTRPSSITADPAGYTPTNSFDFTWPAGTDAVGPGGGASGIAYYQYKRSTDALWTNTTGPDDRAANDLTAYQEGPNTFYVRVVDAAGNTSSNYTQVTYYYSGQAPPKPDNLNVTPTSAAENSFTISWDKPAQGPGDSPIVGYYYSINSPPTALNTTYVASTAANVSIGPDSYATSQGENTVYVVSRNEAGNNSFLPAYYSTDTFNCQTSAPPIPAAVSIHDSSDKALQRFSLSLNWIAGANQNSSTFDHYLIERSTDGSTYTTLSTTTNTSYIDTGLSESTTYYYRLKAVDNASSTSAASSVVSKQPSGRYLTPPSYLSSPAVSAKSNEATITWTTDRNSTSFVRYSKDKDNLADSKGQDEEVTSHTVTIKGLEGNTAYYYQVQSTDRYRDYTLESAYSSQYSFITPAAPSISDVEIKNITLSSADISWKTTTLATSTLNYGETSGYGLTVSDISTTAATGHSAKITSLGNDTAYHFKITGTDEEGAQLTSDDYSFSTLPLPKITGIKITAIPDRPTSTIKAVWETNVDCSTILKYQTAGAASQESVKSKLEKTHEVEVSNLSDNAKYTIYAEGKDQFGNIAQSDKLSYETPFDTRPPKIENIKYEVSSIGLMSGRAQIVISFTTDEPASAYLEYGKGSGNSYTRQTAKEESLKTSFIVAISDLDSLATYQFRINAEDRSQNKTSSKDFVFATPQMTLNPFDAVMRALERLFGWIKL